MRSFHTFPLAGAVMENCAVTWDLNVLTSLASHLSRNEPVKRRRAHGLRRLMTAAGQNINRNTAATLPPL